jgi:hypothetical protein
MSHTSKGFCVLLAALLAASCLMMTATVNAQLMPKPKVPEFTVKLVDHSYDLPANYSINPYTGKRVTQPSIHYSWKTLDIAIANQNVDVNNSSNFLYYNVRCKGNFSEQWSDLLGPSGYLPQNSTGQQTVLSYGLVGQSQNFPPTYSGAVLNIPDGGTVDFQVEALVGHTYANASYLIGPALLFNGTRSGWGNTQAITIEAQTAQTSAFNWGEIIIIVLLGIIDAIIAVGIFFLRKQSRQSKP